MEGTKPSTGSKVTKTHRDKDPHIGEIGNIMAENEEVTPQAGAAEGQQPEGPQFALQRIYVKDASLESPHSPLIFQKQWSPKVKFDIKTKHEKVLDDIYDVNLTLTVEAKLEEETAYLVEVHQAGIFTCKDFDEEQQEQLMAAVCPNILFPYAREVIDSLVTKGGFPPLMLAPINFDQVYAQQKQARAEQAAAAAEAPAED